VTNVTGLASATFNLLRDDGAVVYLNGAEVSAKPAGGNQFPIRPLATTNVSGTATVGLRGPSRPAPSTAIARRHNVLPWRSQSGGTSSDIILNLDLAGNPPPAPPLQPLLSRAVRRPVRVSLGDPGFLLEEDVALGPEPLATVTETGPAASSSTAHNDSTGWPEVRLPSTSAPLKEGNASAAISAGCKFRGFPLTCPQN